MTRKPKWLRIAAIIALLWNVIGCVAILADLRIGPEQIAKLPAAEQAMYAARPLWSVGGSLLAVIAGTFGSLGLLLTRRWSMLLLWASLAGVVLQDLGLWMAANSTHSTSNVAVVMQVMVLAISIGLVVLARRADRMTLLR